MVNALEKNFEQQGTLLFEQKDIPLDENEWLRLEEIINNVDYEHVVGGDAGEGHSVWVCRFYNDVDEPVALNKRSLDVYNIVMSPRMQAFYKTFTGMDRMCLRRCQANKLGVGDYIGIHKDQDSNPDYYATIVFHFDSNYRGGSFVCHDQGQPGKSFHPDGRTILVNNCSLPHEVSSVEQGERKTLACFLSRNFGSSPNKRKQFRVVK